MNKEVILPIEDTGYHVSNYGNVYNREMKLSPYSVDRYGYRQVYVPTMKKVPIHRLVALTFLSKPTGNYQVNHIDGNKENNRVDNLEWVTPRENIIHSYETGLNSNTIPATLTDLKSNTTKRFRSVKHLCRYLSVYSSVLIPYIQYSEKYPFMGRYIVKLNAKISTTNTDNFGTGIYVYDVLNGITCYPSALIASYYTSLRGLSNILRSDPITYEDLGYVVSKSINIPGISSVLNRDEILANREKYYSLTYKPNSKEYKVYNYFTKTEYIFSTQEEVVDFINSNLVNDTIPKITKRELQSMYRYNLCRGFGVKYGNDNTPWKNQYEYVLYCNMYNKYITMVYRYTVSDTDTLIFGKSQLAKEFNLPITMPEYDILKRINDMNLDVCKLDNVILI